ncbi:MAG: LEA type 2 family protein [Treponema sp.]|jgi:LEA14-like dessication related protein|nr:LEA type 2 family protein [Treponema sp.]
MNPAVGFPKNTFLLFLLFLAFCLSCASPAPPPGESAPFPRPRASLSFDRIEAESPERLTLWFNLEAENPRGKDARLASSARSASFNGKTVLPGSAFTVPEGPVAGGEKLAAPLRLDINASDIETPNTEAKEPLKNTAGEYRAELAFDLVFDYGGGETEKVPVKAAASFPLILEPEFRIISVAVKKAELIDTRFKVKIRLKNPNSFPVELSAFSFELYHGGSLWAGGSRKNIMLIPQGQSAEAELLLTMNFIDMRRDLLDQVIAMQQIDYRFAGEATISTGIAYLPHFRWKFDQSGRSIVTN